LTKHQTEGAEEEDSLSWLLSLHFLYHIWLHY